MTPPAAKRRPITAREIAAACSADGGFTRERLAAWGVRWPPRPGWQARLIRQGVAASFPYPEGFEPAREADAAVPSNPLLAFASASPIALPPDAIEVFTDGSCRQGRGGWGFVAYRDGREVFAGRGGETGTTNNRMELGAVIAALRRLDPAEPAILWTDSQYAVRGVLEWRHGWRKAEWSRSGARGSVANADLWRALFALLDGRCVDLRWVRGHAETDGNIRADELATEGRRGLPA